MRGVMSPTKFSAKDFRDLGRYGYKANLIRWQIQRNWGLPNTERDLANYDAWFYGKLDELDQVLSAAAQNGLKVVIDMHTPPGGRYADGSMAMFYEQVYYDHFLKLWNDIAKRYKDNHAVWAYDLINEPTINTATPIYNPKETQAVAAKIVRFVDRATPIIIEPHAVFNGAALPDSYKTFTPIQGIGGLLYEVHVYNYSQHFVDHTACYPGLADGLQWNKSLLEAILSPAVNFHAKYGEKMYVGEFSIPVGSCGAERFLSDFIDLFEGQGWDWTYHAFREAPVWDMEWPDRKDLFLRWFSLNSSSLGGIGG